MGADAPEKQELYPDVFGQADLVACDLKSQCTVRGELHHGLEAGTLPDLDHVVELGELTSGARHGRLNDKQITVCDLTGVGVQTAIALFAFRNAIGRVLAFLSAAAIVRRGTASQARATR